MKSLLELRLANEDRAIAQEYDALAERKYTLQSDLFQQEEQVAFWEAKMENRGAEEFSFIMKGEERKLLERLYRGNGTLTEDFAEQWSKLLSPLDSLKNDLQIEGTNSSQCEKLQIDHHRRGMTLKTSNNRTFS